MDLRAFGGSALTADIDVPKQGVGDDIPRHPCAGARNTIFLSPRSAGPRLRARDIYIGVNALDYRHPDCCPEFIDASRSLAELATAAGVEWRALPHPRAAPAHDQRHRARGRAVGLDMA